MADSVHHGPQRSRVRYVLVLALMAGMMLAGYLAFNVWDRVRALDSAQQDHAEWVFSQLEIDFLKLDGAVEQARSGDESDLANLRKRFDFFYSRTEVAERVQQSGDLTREIQKIQAVLDTQIPLIDGGDATLISGLTALSDALRSIENLPRNIGLASITFAAKAAEAERKQIAQLIEILLVIVVTVTIALLGAILRLSRQTITLNRASREVERNHSQLETMLRASLDAVMVLSVDGEIIDFNGSAEDVFSISRNHALGRSYIELLVPPELRNRQRDNIAHFNATGKTRLAETGRHETKMIDGKGRIFPVELSVSLARSNDAPVFVTYIRDITDKLQKEKEIIRARDEALDAYQEKSRFFAMMSHEMRTPLNGILSAIHLLHDDRLDAEQRNYVEAALKSGDILLGHIDDVLAIERSEAETNAHELQASDMVALTSGLINTMTPLARTSDTRLHLDQDGLTDTPILTDLRAVQQILANLISNAIKFSPDDDIVLSASYDMEDAEAPILHIEVADNGPGIPLSEIKLALSRHATSKISELTDLESICSLGFRGEALASIASVSQLNLSSKHSSDDHAWEISADGGRVSEPKPSALAIGSVVTVSNLYFNTPARKKFLRSPNTEYGHCDEVYKQAALANPTIRFSITHNGKPRRRAQADVVDMRIQETLGSELTDTSIWINEGSEALSIKGLIGQVSINWPPAAPMIPKFRLIFL